jgi:isoaspartyl peptidase/L-asparaginase-like protein (Ntn-hydrolase superfamily)
MRVLPTARAVWWMEIGLSVFDACEKAVREVIDEFPGAHIGLVCADTNGEISAAGANWVMPYVWRHAGDPFTRRGEAVRID